MPSENEWVDSLVDRFQNALQAVSVKDANVRVVSHTKLAYLQEVLAYTDDLPELSASKYETDLLVLDDTGDGRWIPRVVIEGKLKSVTTHDALTYSAKAATHKQVHPYLRYGILIGNRQEYAIPGRLFRHGAYFDFMATWRDAEPSDDEWYDLIGVLTDEIKSSRKIQEFLTSSRSPDRRRYSLVHRPMKLK